MKLILRIAVIWLCCAVALVALAHFVPLGQIVRKLHGG